MTHQLKALIRTVILAPKLKLFALHYFQRSGTTLYVIEWIVSYPLSIAIAVATSVIYHWYSLV